MSVAPGLLLGNAADCLFQVVASRPELGEKIGTAAALIALIAPDLDTYVSDRLHRAQQIRALLVRAGDILEGGAGGEVEEALTRQLSAPSDYALHHVEAHLNTLRAALMAVHVRLEILEGKAARDLMTDVWSVLREDVEHASRRVPGLL